MLSNYPSIVDWYIAKSATQFVPVLQQVSYEEGLERLSTLEERREKGNLIMIFKSIMGMENVGRESFLIRDSERTRGVTSKN